MFADVTLVEVLLPVIALLGLYNLIANYIDLETRRESIGGVHDRLDALMGRRCAWCDKHLNDGAIDLPGQHVCGCPKPAGAAEEQDGASEDAAGRRAPGRRRRRRRRRPRRREQGEEQPR